MELSEKDTEVLGCIWVKLGLGKITEQVGIDEIADVCSFETTDDKIHEICKDLTEKGYLRLSGRDVIYTRDTEKMHLKLNL